MKVAKRNRDLGRKYKVPRTPSLVLVDGDGELLVPLYGYIPAADYLKWLKGVALIARHPGAARGKGDDAAAYRTAADGFARIQYDGKAIELYAKALEWNDKRPANGETRKFKAETLSRKGFSHYMNHDESETVKSIADEILKLDHDGTLGTRDNALFLKALVGAGDVPALVDEAISRYPDSDVMDGLLYVKGYCLQQKGEKEAARKLFSQVVEKYPDSFFRLDAEDALK